MMLSKGRNININWLSLSLSLNIALEWNSDSGYPLICRCRFGTFLNLKEYSGIEDLEH